MRIVVHDFAGHPFQVQLSRWLGTRGHEVVHAYCADIETPRGALSPREDDAAAFSIKGVTIGRPFNKYNLAQRIIDEWAYASKLLAFLAAEKPEVVLSANASPIVQARIERWAQRNGVRFVYWLQDIHSVALDHAMSGAKAAITWPLRMLFRNLELGTLSRSQAIVAISEDFGSLLAGLGVKTNHLHVIENWAPAEEVRVLPKSNPWSLEAGLDDKFVFLYSGTLGMKHNPALLSALADAFRSLPDVRIVVISQGLGRQWLEEEKARRHLDNLLLFDFVAFEKLPECLAASDVQIAILEPHAGVLSVPSKVLTYIAAERPILAAIPPSNLGARIIKRNDLGEVVPPDDTAAFSDAAHRLHTADLGGYAARLRTYKAENFDIERIGQRFLRVLGPVSPGPKSQSSLNRQGCDGRWHP